MQRNLVLPHLDRFGSPGRGGTVNRDKVRRYNQRQSAINVVFTTTANEAIDVLIGHCKKKKNTSCVLIAVKSVNVSMAAPTQFSPLSYSVYGTWLIVTEVMFYARLALRSPDETLNHTSILMSKASYASHPEPIYVTKM